MVMMTMKIWIKNRSPLTLFGGDFGWGGGNAFCCCQSHGSAYPDDHLQFFIVIIVIMMIIVMMIMRKRMMIIRRWCCCQFYGSANPDDHYDDLELFWLLHTIRCGHPATLLFHWVQYLQNHFNKTMYGFEMIVTRIQDIAGGQHGGYDDQHHDHLHHRAHPLARPLPFLWEWIGGRW